MTSLTAEAVEQRLAALEQHLALVAQEFADYRQAYSPEITNGLRSELEALRTRLESTGPRRFRLVDPKNMTPEVFGDSGNWQVWSHKAKAYIGMLSATLPLDLTAMEALEEPVTESQLSAANISPEHELELARFLLLQTAGVPHQIVKGAQAEKVSALETWRRLAFRYDPKGLGSDLLELQELTAPERIRAKTLEGLSAAIQSWEALERRHSERQGLVLPEKVRIAILLKLAPADLARELCRQTTKWKSYSQLKDHLHSLQHCRAASGQSFVGNLDPEEVVTDDGDILRLERRDGRTTAVKTGRQATGPTRAPNARFPRDRNSRSECFRCGRTGHIRPNCTYDTHINGGPPKELSASRKTTNNLEAAPAGNSAEPRVIGHLEINALEAADWKQLYLQQACEEADEWLRSRADDDGWDEYLKVEEERAAAAEEVAIDPWSSPAADPWIQPHNCALSEAQAPARPTYASLLFTPFDASQLNIPVHLQTPLSSLFNAENQEEPEVLDWFPERHLRDAQSQTEAPSSCSLGVQTEACLVAPDTEKFHDCLPDLSDSDLLAFDLDLTPVDRPGYEEVRVTMDSGAAEPVCNPETFPDVEVTPSPGSIAGQMYLGPGKEQIPNQGQLKPRLVLEDGGTGDFTFQAAAVRKPLMAVSSVNDKGHMVLFDLLGSYVLPASAPEVEQIRALAKKVKGRIAMHRENGIFNLKTWRKVFPRPGK